MHGFWNRYFAGRAAPLGEVGPAPVTALFFGFAPAMVAKAIPKVWGRITPEQANEARLGAVSRTMTPLLAAGSADDVRRVIDRLTAVATEVATDGRALAAAWQGIGAPEGPAARLWWATTVLREHRGDGHVHAAVSAGLSGLEAGVTHVATDPLTREAFQPSRGWTDAEWDAAVERLASRGILEPDGSLSEAGRILRDGIEAETDRLAHRPAAELAEVGTEVPSVLGGLARAIVEAGSRPYLNPMGVPIPN